MATGSPVHRITSTIMSESLSTSSLHLTIASPKSKLVKTPPSTKTWPSIIVGANAGGIDADAQIASGNISNGVVSSKITT